MKSLTTILACCLTLSALAQNDSNLLFKQRVDVNTPGHAAKIDVDIRGAARLYLVVTGAENGTHSDWADWAEPHLVGPDGQKKLTELPWRYATSGWRDVQINKDVTGRDLNLAGSKPAYGIGTHAYSLISYDLPVGYERFRASCGLDFDCVQREDAAATASIEVLVYRDTAPEEIRRRAAISSRDAEDAIIGLEVAEDLQVTLFAAEPMITNPSSMHVDARGRVWICEMHNYRKVNRPEGDRILILEDTNSDGRADQQKVFYQGNDINDAQGICVLGSRVFVTCTKTLLVLHDDNGDDVADRQETLFTATGHNHDHSLHAVLPGPDGRLYGNCGDTTKRILDRDGNTVLDIDGLSVDNDNSPYIGGMAFRCNFDGSDFEVLGHNFRNPWELTVDSFGSVWQSDNDDDGNRAVRINHFLEYGNYGFRDEKTRAAWPTPRTGMSEFIPHRHWHLNDPGVVPNLLQLGNGAPTSICVYEGNFLPERFHGSLIHCDTGPHVVRVHPLKQRGSSFDSTIIGVIDGSRDEWFRPTDVCVAPDGSVFVSDWYDPVVGGHQMHDSERGRIFRLTPRGDAAQEYIVPKQDFSTVQGAIAALHNPAISVWFEARERLMALGEESVPALRQVLSSNRSTHVRARALWILGEIQDPAARQQDMLKALQSPEPRIRVTALRLARRLKMDVAHLAHLTADPSPYVRREYAIALRHCRSMLMPQLWSKVAAQHVAGDRWHLEALGIGAHGRWDECLESWLTLVGDDWMTPAGLDIIWRSRAKDTAELLAQIIDSPQVDTKSLPRYFRALDLLPREKTVPVLRSFARRSNSEEFNDRQRYILTQTLARLDKKTIAADEELAKTATLLLESTDDAKLFVELVRRLELEGQYDRLLEVADRHAGEQLGVEALKALLDRGQHQRIASSIDNSNSERAQRILRTLGLAATHRSIPVLEPLVRKAELEIELRRETVRALAKTKNGAHLLLERARNKRLDKHLHAAAGAALQSAPWPSVRKEALSTFGSIATSDAQEFPPMEKLLATQSFAPNGAEIFRTKGTCANCHVVGGEGKSVGPDLSEIGAKLSREALFQSILYPSAAISHNYDAYVAVTDSGDVATGLLVNKTPDEVTIKSADSILHTFATSELTTLEKQSTSLMPADLASALSRKELVDLVAYLVTLRPTLESQALNFERITVDPLFRSEGVGAADIDGDGDQDVVVGDLWFEAPSWTQHEIRTPRNPERSGYTESFGVYTDDYNRDGHVDVLVIPFHGKDATWYENPGSETVRASSHWKERIAFRETGNEARLYVDLFETGTRVFLMGIENRIAWVPVPDDPTVEPWPHRTISTPNHAAAHKFAHGLGIGDVDGDGRNDVISSTGWWKQPENGPDFPFEWHYHEVTIVPDQAAEMYCLDADLDGRNDIFCTSAHGRGVYWCRQTGERWDPSFETHRLDESIYETHALNFVDVDGDGTRDLVTGRRFCTHGYRPERDSEPSELGWYKIVPRRGKPPQLIRHVIDDQSGVGTQFVTLDLDGNDRIDVLVSNRKGVYLFRQR